MYSQRGEILCSELVFGEIEVRNILSWTSMIAGYVQNGFFERGLGTFQQMVSLATQPNAVTLVSILPACAHLEFLTLGKLIHGYAVKLGVDSIIALVNALIALYGKCGNVDTARSLFGKMSVQTWCHGMLRLLLMSRTVMVKMLLSSSVECKLKR